MLTCAHPEAGEAHHDAEQGAGGGGERAELPSNCHGTRVDPPDERDERDHVEALRRTANKQAKHLDGQQQQFDLKIATRGTDMVAKVSKPASRLVAWHTNRAA